MRFSIKSLAIGVFLGSAGIAMSATVTTLYLSGGTPGTSGHIPVFTSDGLGLQDGGAANQKFTTTSWVAGMTLQGKSVPLAHFGSASTVTGLVCRPEVVTGGTSTINIYFAASGTACASGTNLTSSTSCNGNGTALTDQTLSGSTTAITANTDICAVFSNDAAWTSTTGTGFIQLSTSTP